MRLQGKTAIITGAAQGIGREYALRFAREGTAVAVVDLREEQGAAVARGIVKTDATLRLIPEKYLEAGAPRRRRWVSCFSPPICPVRRYIWLRKTAR